MSTNTGKEVQPHRAHVSSAGRNAHIGALDLGVVATREDDVACSVLDHQRARDIESPYGFQSLPVCAPHHPGWPVNVTKFGRS